MIIRVVADLIINLYAKEGTLVKIFQRFLFPSCQNLENAGGTCLNIDAGSLWAMNSFQNLVRDINEDIEREKHNYEKLQHFHIANPPKLLIPLFDQLNNGISIFL